jgi:hypothetical protein
MVKCSCLSLAHDLQALNEKLQQAAMTNLQLTDPLVSFGLFLRPHTKQRALI